MEEKKLPQRPGQARADGKVSALLKVVSTDHGSKQFLAGIFSHGIHSFQVYSSENLFHESATLNI